MKKKYTDEIVNEIHHLRDRHKSYAQIADTLNKRYPDADPPFSWTCCRDAMRRAGYKTPSILPFREEVLAFLRPLFWEGMSFAECGRRLTAQFGYRYTGDTVQRACARYMLQRSPEKQAEIDDHYQRKKQESGERLTVEAVNFKRLDAALPGERSLAYVSIARRPPDNPRKHVVPGTFHEDRPFSMLRRLG